LESSAQKPLALVTGGATGIGAACCRELARAGYRVAIHYNKSEVAAADLARELGDAILVRADLTSPTGVDEIYERMKREGALEVLVNNAGVSYSRPLAMTSLEEYHKVVAINLTAVWHLTKRLSLLMVRRKKGRIVNISSVVGSTGNAMQSVYALTKAGVDNFTRTAARELAPYGVLVNAVCPGLIDTRLADEVPEDVQKAILEMVPLARKGTPEEVARLVRFLVTEGTYCTGSLFQVNGGLYCG
jgi:NAD(P)-dependent dehydrogenase (short-subunit alcohol dehydrogenase family)